jgi:hypothetical protein
MEPATVAGAGGEAAAGRLDTGAHAREPPPAVGSRPGRAAAAVGDLDDHLVVLLGDADQGPGRAGVAQDVAASPADEATAGLASRGGWKASRVVRSSVSALVLVSRIASREWRAWSGRSSNTSSATPACMATAANPCPATSWTSCATRIRSSSATLATRSCRARSAAVDRTWTSAPSDQGTTSQLIHPSTSTAGRSASRTSRDSTKVTATAAASPHASSEVRTRWRRATSNIATTMHSWIGP